MQISTLINRSHLCFIVSYNFNKVSHNVRKESHSSKLYNQGAEPLLVTDRVEISVTHRTECRKGKVATHDELMGAGYVL